MRWFEFVYSTYKNSSIFLKIYLVLVRPCSSLLLIWIFVQSWKHPFARGLRLCEDFDQCWTTVKVFFSRVYKLKAGNFFMPISNNKTRLIDFSGTLISVEPLSKFFFVRVYKLKAGNFSCQFQIRPGYSTSRGLWSLLNSGSTFTFFLQYFCQSLLAQSF